MSEEYRNIYKIARRTAGFTQEAAAERLGISVESVRAYEIGQRIPPNDIVNAMVSCYGTQHLAVQHLQENNVLFGQVIPQLEERSVLEVTVRIYNRLRRFQKDNRLDRLLAIAEDGIIDDQERPEFEAIIADLRQIIQSGLELEVYCKDGN
ncbi:XRE family transcriptional regulator [bacterium 1xD42-67]|mgnify:CR=1 FL=1|nr:XRE family transcriptional regulator [bacterium 1xD42-67]